MSAERRAAPPRRRSGVGTIWVFALLVTGTVAAAWLVDDGAPLGPRSLAVPSTLATPLGADCDRWSVLAGRGQERAATVALFTDGVVVAHACSDAVRTLLLEGSSARGVGAFVVVRDANGVRFDDFVDGSVTLTVRGDLRVAFTNDLATADEDRNLHATLR